MCVFHRIKISALELLRIWLGLEIPLLVSVPTSSVYDGDLFSGSLGLKATANSESQSVS